MHIPAVHVQLPVRVDYNNTSTSPDNRTLLMLLYPPCPSDATSKVDGGERKNDRVADAKMIVGIWYPYKPNWYCKLPNFRLNNLRSIPAWSDAV